MALNTYEFTLQDQFYLTPMQAIRAWNDILAPESAVESLATKVRLALPQSSLNRKPAQPLFIAPWNSVFSKK